jgi:hypothetical protein
VPSAATALPILSAVAYTVLAAGAVLLWNRTRSFATAMIAIGFALVLLDKLAAVVEQLEISAVLRAHSIDTLYIVSHDAFRKYVSLFGLLLAGFGVLWHGVRIPRR